MVAIEDSRFYEHRGVDFQGLGRALMQDIITPTAQRGAATRSEQRVKQALEATGDGNVAPEGRESISCVPIVFITSAEAKFSEAMSSIPSRCLLSSFATRSFITESIFLFFVAQS